jgi:hypothetical protein
MISNDTIHVQVKEGGEDGNVEGIGTSETNDYLCAMHDVGVVLNLLLLRIHHHNQDKEHTYITYGMDMHLV